ncbi:SUN domain-containing protein 3 isoform X2 [Talpa occidentalis]|uniref:SUN domain-containing protein 3 isoform X2 n=1 Tax=Talpa occidentalis TaxID=50954 RepID=UPI0023F87D8F|nr:SUN domain-containing protein 3 isoform X2 [Talpa occidentalis]
MSGRPKSRRRARYFRGRAEEGSSSASMNVIHPEPRNPDFRGLTRSWKTILSVVCTLTFLLIGLRNHTQLKETEFPQNTRHFYALIADYASRLYNYQIKLRTPKVQLELLKKESQTLEKNFQEILVLIEQIDVLKALLRDMRNSLSNYSWETGGEPTEDEDHMGVEDEEMSNLVDYVLKVFREDQVQMADYALKSADVHPGKCWAFPGSQGHVLIKLAREIIPTAVTMEHISEKVSPSGNISSAPKEFSVYGILKQCEGEEIFLGQFIYNKKGITVQTFTIQHEVSESLVCVKLKILSNWGHPKYTCLYRFRVHGTPGDHT